MKTLYLVRHAKSSWAMDSQPDIDRPLNERGYIDAHAMSKHLYKEKQSPELIIASPAIRTMSTALIFAGNLRYDKEAIVMRTQLYESTRQEYLDCIHALDNNVSVVMIVGHNPVTSELAEYFIPRRSEDMPTCAVTCIEFKNGSWKDLSKGSGVL